MNKAGAATAAFVYDDIAPPTAVILGLEPRIHAPPAAVDAWVKPEHDGGEVRGALSAV